MNIELDENLRMITESVAAAKARGHESMFDCEHYFDGYKANPDYALSCVQAAHQVGHHGLSYVIRTAAAFPMKFMKL